MTDIFTQDRPDDEDQQEARAGRRRLGRPAKVVLAVVAGLVAVALVIAVGLSVFAANLAREFDSGTTKLDQAFPEDTSRPAIDESGALNVLLLGSDSRGDATTLEDASASDQRTDTMMLVHVSADRRRVDVMSIMRDLWVPIPGRGEAKINASFAYGGSPLAVQTVEDLLGVRIDHVAIIDFEGFAGMTEALGGVDVLSEKAFAVDGESYAAGMNHLEGERALLFVRARYAFVDGDYQRVRNQQAFLRAVVDRVISRDTLTDPGALTDFVGSVSRYLTVDAGLDSATLASLGLSLRDLDQADVNFFTIPTAGTGTSADGQSIVNLSPYEMPALRGALQADTMAAYAAANPTR